jgi:general stress protein 26
MSKPIPEPINPDQLEDLALAVVKADRSPQLATIDGDQPRVRPISPVKLEGFTIYIANFRRYSKTAEIAANPRVETVFLDDDHNHVRITGVVEVVDDRAVLQEIWDSNPLLRNYLGSIDDPELILYRIVPNRVRYMKGWAKEYHEVPLGVPKRSS